MEFHNINIEKASAMRRYRRKQNLEYAFRFFNLSVALFLFSRSSCFPITLQILCHLYTQFASLFNHPFYVFLLGNLIILFIYALSHKNAAPNDVCDQFLSNTESPLKITADTESPLTLNNPQHLPPGKQIICPEVAESPVSDQTVTAVTETRKTTTTTTTTSCTTVSRSINGEKVSERKCYRRVQSESFGRRIVVGPRRELKRLNTEVSREVVRYGRELERRLCSVEELSNEEFNRTIEEFIAKHRRMQLEEHRESHKTEHLALTQ